MTKKSEIETDFITPTNNDQSSVDELLSSFFYGLIHDVMNMNPKNFETLFSVILESRSKEPLDNTQSDKTWSVLRDIYQTLLDRICSNDEPKNEEIPSEVNDEDETIDEMDDPEIEAILTEDFVIKNDAKPDSQRLTDFKVEKLVNDLKTEFIFPELLREIKTMRNTKLSPSESMTFIKDVLEILKETRNVARTKSVVPLEKIDEEVENDPLIISATKSLILETEKVAKQKPMSAPEKISLDPILPINNIQLSKYVSLIDIPSKQVKITMSDIDLIGLCNSDAKKKLDTIDKDHKDNDLNKKVNQNEYIEAGSSETKYDEWKGPSTTEDIDQVLEDISLMILDTGTLEEPNSLNENISEMINLQTNPLDTETITFTDSIENTESFTTAVESTATVSEPVHRANEDNPIKNVYDKKVSLSKISSKVETTSKLKLEQTKSNSSLSSGTCGRILTAVRSKSTPSLRKNSAVLLPNGDIIENMKAETSARKKTDESASAVPLTFSNNEKLVFNAEITNVLKTAKTPQQMVEKLKLLANKINLYNYDKQYHATLRKLNDIKDKLNHKSKRNVSAATSKHSGVTDIPNQALNDLHKSTKSRTNNHISKNHQHLVETDMLLPKTKYIAKRLEIKSDPSEMKCRVRLVLSEVKSKSNRKDADDPNETNFINQETTARLRQIFKNFKQVESPKVVITSPKINEIEREKLMKSVPQFINNILLKDEKSKPPEKLISKPPVRPMANLKIMKAPKKTTSLSDTETDTQVDSEKSDDTDLKSLGSLTQLPAYSQRRPVHYDMPEPADPKYVTSETKLLRSITADIIQPIKSEYTKEVQLASVKPIASTNTTAAPKSNVTAAEIVATREEEPKKNIRNEKSNVKFKKSDDTEFNQTQQIENKTAEASILTFRDVIQLKILANNLTSYFRRSGRSFDTIIPLTIKTLYNRGVGLTRYQCDKWKYHNSRNCLYGTRFSEITHCHPRPHSTLTLTTVDLAKRITTDSDHTKKHERSVRFSPELVSKIEKNTVPQTGSVKAVLKTLDKVLDDVSWDGKSEKNDTPRFNEFDIIGKLSASTIEDSVTVNLKDLIAPASDVYVPGFWSQSWAQRHLGSNLGFNPTAIGKVDV